MRFKCTGCGTDEDEDEDDDEDAPPPTAAATARSTSSSRKVAGSSSVGQGRSFAWRAYCPKMPGWVTAWFAPLPRDSGARSAVRSSSGSWLWLASTAAGSRFATAVPDVVSTAASFFSSPPPLPPPDRA